MSSAKSILCLTAAAALAGGCASTTELEPAPSASTLGEDVAVTTEAGVRMRVVTDAWPGASGVTDDVTPVRVRIENNAQVPLRIRYSELVLVGPEGERYRALPPYRVDGAVVRPEPEAAYAPIEEPGFDYEGYMVAPAYAPIYTGLNPVTGPFLMDPLYYETYYSYWEQTELPTQDMLQLALPEGVLAPGGSVNGYLYFEKVPEERQLELSYRADLVNARTEQVFAELEIPVLANPGA